MYKLLTVFLIIALFFSCKKGDDNNVNTALNWKIGPNTYNGTVVKDSIPGSWHALAENSMFIINFKDSLIPGNYNIVYFAKDSFQMNIAVSTTIDGVQNYYATGNLNATTATVSIDTAHKTVVHIPEVWAYNTFNSKDSLKISGTITK